jgi:hypothetical protein
MCIIPTRGLPEAFALNVNRKGCTKKMPYYLYAHDDITMHCGVRGLMGYIVAAGIKGGYMFPSEKELKNPPADGIFKTTITAKELYKKLEHVCDKILHKSSKHGAHSFRKTAYLFAILGKGSIEIVMRAANHLCFQTAEKYARLGEHCSSHLAQSTPYRASTQVVRSLH